MAGQEALKAQGEHPQEDEKEDPEFQKKESFFKRSKPMINLILAYKDLIWYWGDTISEIVLGGVLMKNHFYWGLTQMLVTIIPYYSLIVFIVIDLFRCNKKGKPFKCHYFWYIGLGLGFFCNPNLDKLEKVPFVLSDAETVEKHHWFCIIDNLTKLENYMGLVFKIYMFVMLGDLSVLSFVLLALNCVQILIKIIQKLMLVNDYLKGALTFQICVSIMVCLNNLFYFPILVTICLLSKFNAIVYFGLMGINGILFITCSKMLYCQHVFKKMYESKDRYFFLIFENLMSIYPDSFLMTPKGRPFRHKWCFIMGTFINCFILTGLIFLSVDSTDSQQLQALCIWMLDFLQISFAGNIFVIHLSHFDYWLPQDPDTEKEQ